MASQITIKFFSKLKRKSNRKRERRGRGRNRKKDVPDLSSRKEFEGEHRIIQSQEQLVSRNWYKPSSGFYL